MDTCFTQVKQLSPASPVLTIFKRRTRMLRRGVVQSCGRHDWCSSRECDFGPPQHHYAEFTVGARTLKCNRSMVPHAYPLNRINYQIIESRHSVTWLKCRLLAAVLRKRHAEKLVALSLILESHSGRRFGKPSAQPVKPGDITSGSSKTVETVRCRHLSASAARAASAC
jgi:hypothetical protein